MLHGERFAWVWLASLLIIFGAYFIAVALVDHAEIQLSVRGQIGLLALGLTTLARIAGADFLYGLLRRGPEDGPDLDERDASIELRSASSAYYVLMTGVIVVGCVMPFTKSGWEIVHAALSAIVMAEVVHYAMVLRGYRVVAHD